MPKTPYRQTPNRHQNPKPYIPKTDQGDIREEDQMKIEVKKGSADLAEVAGARLSGSGV